jgi:hypothetical protein
MNLYVNEKVSKALSNYGDLLTPRTAPGYHLGPIFSNEHQLLEMVPFEVLLDVDKFCTDHHTGADRGRIARRQDWPFVDAKPYSMAYMRRTKPQLGTVEVAGDCIKEVACRLTWPDSSYVIIQDVSKCPVDTSLPRRRLSHTGGLGEIGSPSIKETPHIQPNEFSGSKRCIGGDGMGGNASYASPENKE